MYNKSYSKAKGIYFTLHPYIFLVKGKKKGALYDLHNSMIYPIPESAKYVISLCEKHIPIKEIFAEIDSIEDKEMALGYMKQLEEYDFGKFTNKLDSYVKTFLKLPDLEKKDLSVLWIEVPIEPLESDLSFGELLNIIQEAKIMLRTTQLGLVPTEKLTTKNISRFIQFFDHLNKIQIQNVEILLIPCKPFKELISLLERGIPRVFFKEQDRHRVEGFVDILAAKGITVNFLKNLSPSQFDWEKHKTLQVTENIFSIGYITFRRLRSMNVISNRLFIQRNGDIFPCWHETKNRMGNIKGHSIVAMVESEEVQKIWTLTKDHIEKCKNCEFRYACLNSQIFRKSVNKYSSQPMNCFYNPDKGEWEKKDVIEKMFHPLSISSSGSIQINHSKYFKVYSHKNRPYPRDYLELIDSVIDRTLKELKLTDWTYPIDYLFYPSVEDFEKHVERGMDISGKMEVSHQVEKRITYKVYSTYPCHTHEIVHAILHTVQSEGNLFVQESAASIFGVSWGTKSDILKDSLKESLKKNEIKIFTRDGEEIQRQDELMFVYDENGLITGHFRTYKSVHELANWYFKELKSNISIYSLFHLTPTTYKYWSYEVGGSFFLFLLERFGAEPFLDFYRSCQTPAHFKNTFGIDIQKIEDDWKEYIQEKYSFKREKINE